MSGASVGVRQPPTSFTTLSSDASTAVPGQPVTLTATVTLAGGGVPTGFVTFYQGVTELGTATLVGGLATLITSALTSGDQAITAVYSGALAGVDVAGDLDQFVQFVPVVTLTSDFDPANIGQTVMSERADGQSDASALRLGNCSWAE